MAPSFWQILIVVALIFVIFGAGRLPRIMGDLAEGINSFKKGLKEDDTAQDDATKELPSQTDKDKSEIS